MLASIRKMNDPNHPVLLPFGNIGLILANLILGFSMMDVLNIAVAATGMLVTLMANIDRIVLGFIRIRELRRNGWRLPQQPDGPTEPATANQPDKKA